MRIRNLLFMMLMTGVFMVPLRAEQPDSSAVDQKGEEKTIQTSEKKSETPKSLGTIKPRTNWSKVKDLFM